MNILLTSEEIFNYEFVMKKLDEISRICNKKLYEISRICNEKLDEIFLIKQLTPCTDKKNYGILQVLLGSPVSSFSALLLISSFVLLVRYITRKIEETNIQLIRYQSRMDWLKNDFSNYDAVFWRIMSRLSGGKL